MELEKQVFEKDNLKRYIGFVQKYASIVEAREAENDTWKKIQATKVETFGMKIEILAKLDGVHTIFVEYLENGADANFRALVQEVYEGIVGLVDGSPKDFIDRESLFINTEIQKKMIALWQTFNFAIPDMEGKNFLPNWRGQESVDYSPGQLFLIKHASHFLFNVLKFEEVKRSGADISPEDFAHYLLPVFFLPVGCLDFTLNANQCQTGLISLNYRDRTVVNV